MRDPVTLAIVVTDAPDLHGRLLATLHAALPRVGVLDPCAFVCDLAGTEELLGAPTRIARNVLARCARAGARASAGIAPTPFVARVVAERTPPGEVRLVDDGRAFLAPLPLDVLPVDVKVHDELRLLGLRTVGEFADLPRGSVFDRFGSAVARAHALARGEYGDMVRASAPPRRIRARRAWDDAIGSREQLVFALRVVVDEISVALARDGFAALRLELRLDREDAGPLRIERTVLPPTREAAALLRSLRWALEERSELGLVTGCALDAERRVCWISFVQSQCLCESFPVLSSEFLGGPFEAGCPLEDHRFKSEISALAERNRFTRRRRMSSCASRSPRCHSSVQKYACDASTRLFLRRMISSGARTSATKTSPSDTCMRRRTSEGRVIWPLRRRVRTGEAFVMREEYQKVRTSEFHMAWGCDHMRLFAEPLSAKLVWDEGELVALIVSGHRHTVGRT